MSQLALTDQLTHSSCFTRPRLDKSPKYALGSWIGFMSGMRRRYYDFGIIILTNIHTITSE
jgi:hypothetical protein